MSINPITAVSEQEAKKKNTISVEGFLELMVAQLKNQDFNNPVDDTQYMAQMAQFASLQAMQNMSGFTQSTYAIALVGKQVSAQKDGTLIEGVVTGIQRDNKTFMIQIGNQTVSIEQITGVHNV